MAHYSPELGRYSFLLLVFVFLIIVHKYLPLPCLPSHPPFGAAASTVESGGPLPVSKEESVTLDCAHRYGAVALPDDPGSPRFSRKTVRLHIIEK